MNCTNQQPPQRDGVVPNPVWVELKLLLAFPRGPVIPGTPLTQTMFSLCSRLNDRRRVARSLFEIGLSSLFSCLSLAGLLILFILLLLLMTGNVYPNPCPVFPCLVCTGNVTWRCRSVQCCICSNWVHLKCSLLSFSRIRTLGSSHSWSCPHCCVPAFFGDPTPTSTVTSFSDSSIWYTSTAQSGPLLLMQHSHPTLAFKPSILFLPTLYFLPLHPHHRLMLLAISLYLLLPLSLLNSLRVLQWNAGGLRARSTELVYFISSHPVEFNCIQESNLNLSSSSRIHGFSALRSDSTLPPPRSGIFSTDVTDASGGVIIFVRQGLSFSELSTSPFSSLDPYSDCVEVNISLNDSS